MLLWRGICLGNLDLFNMRLKSILVTVVSYFMKLLIQQTVQLLVKLVLIGTFLAGQYFTKVECFCFVEQVLQPGERVTMPVSFYIDPEIINDREAKFVKSVTLSYTFYEIELPNDEIRTSHLVHSKENELLIN